MPGKRAQLEEVAHRLGVEDIPASWETHWAAFLDWTECHALCWELQSAAVGAFDLPVESLPDLRGMYEAIRANRALAELADFWHYLIYHLPEGMERNTNVWNVPDELAGCSTKLFSLAVMVSGADHALENFAATGVSSEVAAASLSYIGRYARDIKHRRGVWGLESVGWLSNYVRANIFRLGRLTFKAGKCGLPFRAFRNRRTGEVVMLCDSAGSYRPDGLANGANNIFDPEPWTPVLEIAPDTITGHPVSAEGVAVREPVTLLISEWEQVMAPGDDAVEVHIAGGSKMGHADCIDAYAQAVEFFPTYYPQADFKGFTCWSWLLDPNLAKILPPESNIVQFQRDFHQLPVVSDESQAYDLVFGDSKTDPAKFPCTTQLQKAIADYVRAGGRLRSAGGIITWDEAVRMARRQIICPPSSP